jgi:hypothetical protein
MKKSIAAVLAGSSVFALAAAAASQLTVNGVSDPKAGSAVAVTCDVGDVSVTPVHDGTKLNALKLTTTKDGSADAGCAGYTIYAKVAVTGTGSPGSHYYFLDSLTANADYTGGTTADFGTGAGGKVFTTFAAGAPGTKVAAPNLADVTLGTVSVVVAASAPTGDTTTPVGWGA